MTHHPFLVIASAPSTPINLNTGRNTNPDSPLYQHMLHEFQTDDIYIYNPLTGTYRTPQTRTKATT